MGGPIDAALARRLLRQQAQTARFLGVDFVPVRADLPSEPAVEPQLDPQDKFAVAWGPSRPPPEPPPRPARKAPPRAAPGTGYRPVEIPAGTLTREAAQALLDEVRARYEADAPHQHFVTDHTNIVFGEGDPCADLMFIGEAPGETEDRTGRPFVGKAGQLLDKMIVAMGLSREGVYICNVLKTRPPNNATPTVAEAALCAPCLLDQIRVVRPRVIVALGLPASRLLLGTEASMRELRGRFHPFPPPGGQGVFSSVPGLPPITVMPTYHPAYLLRSYTPENRRKVWSDLKQVMDELAPPSR